MTAGKLVKKRDKFQTPDEEQRLLMEKGGPLITEPYVLGRNFAGDQLVLPPLQPGESLDRIIAGKHRSFDTAAAAAAKSFSLRHGPGIDVNDCVPCYHLDGQRRPPIPPDQRAHTRTFIDSMVASSTTSSKAAVIDFFRCFTLTDSGSPLTEQRISMKPISGEKGTGKHKWLIKTANIPIKLMRFLLSVYRFGIKWDCRPTTFANKAETPEWVNIISSFELDAADILKAVTLVQRREFEIHNWDTTRDIAGTLDAQAFAEAAKQNGYEITLNSKCGKNCVKVRPGAGVDTLYNYQLKAYNKPLETMQQGTVRGNGLPACKFEKLLNPSTPGLKQITYDDRYNKHGITRLENTVHFISNKIPSWMEMEKIMNFGQDLLNDALVTCSIHDHIEMMGAYAQTSIALYFPHVFDLKRLKWLMTHEGNRKEVSDDLKTSNPDGLVIRYVHSGTGKMNGVVVNGIHGTVKPDKTGWTQMLHTLAACPSGTHIMFYICVAGGEHYLGQPGLSNLYFRRVVLIRSPIAPNMHLQTHFLARNDVPSDCNFDMMNVDIDSLTSLKPCVTKSAHLRTQNLQIDISIDGNFELPKLEDFQSEGTEAISKYQGGTRLVKEEYMPVEFKPIRELKIRQIGRFKTPRCVMNFEGLWLWVPANYHKRLETYADNPNYTVLVRWGELGFEAKTEAKEGCTGTDICSSPTDPGGTVNLTGMERGKFLGRPSAMGSIPVGKHEIMSVGFRKHGHLDMTCYICIDLHDSLYYLPTSLTQQILLTRKLLGVEIKQQDTDIQFGFLDRCFILRHTEGLIRVSGQKNAEPPVSITDSNGKDMFWQQETAKSAKKRKIASIEM